MANVNWNQVYQPSDNLILQGNPALQELQQGIAQQRRQQQLDNKDYAAQVAKLNFGGAKDADLDYLQKQYGGILNTFAELRANNNPRTRAELGQKLQQQQNEFLYSIEKSKQANKQELELAELPLNPNANLEPDAPDRIIGLTRLSTFDPTRPKMYEETVGRLFAPKPVDWNKETGTIFKGLLGKETNTAIEKDPTTGMLVNKKTVTESVDKNAYMQGVLNRLKDPQVLRAAKRDFGGDTEAQVAQNITNATYDNYAKALSPDITTGQPFETPAQRDARSLAKQKEFALWKEANGLSGTSTKLTPAQILINNMKNSVPNSGEKFLSLIPNDQYDGEKPKIGILKNTGEQVFTFPSYMKGNAYIDKKVYKLNPNSPDYLSQVAQMAADQNVNLSRLNSIEAEKGGRGQIEPARVVNRPSQSSKVKTVTSQADYNSIPKGAQYMAPDGKLYIKK